MFRKLKDRVTNKKGFTLVELIVVIVIILVLAAVMVPNVIKYVDKAAKSNTKQEAATMLIQIQVEVADNYTTTDEDLKEVKLAEVTAKKKDALSIANKDTKAAEYVVSNGEVTAFAYCDKKHYIRWTAAEGWYEVDSTTAPTSTPTPPEGNTQG